MTRFPDDPLARSLEINGVRIKNRLAKAATHENMADVQGLITEQYGEYYNQLSAGGVGLIVTGHMYVNLNGRNYLGMTGAESDLQIPRLQKVADAVHANGSVIFAQLNHAGLKAVYEPGVDKKIKGPSRTYRAGALTLEEVEDIIRDFGKSALRIKKAGFDGVQIQGGHTYLIGQFLSRRMNRRRDHYGGSLENRQRFCLEVYQTIRDQVGPDFPIIMKLDSNARSYASIPPLISLIAFKEALNTAHRLEDAGIDAIEVTCGFLASRGALPYKQAIIEVLRMRGELHKAAVANMLLTPLDLWINHNIWFKPHHNIDHIKAFKKHLNVPILAGSCFNDPAYMRQVLKHRYADMISLARPLVFNPNFPNQILNKSHKESQCVHCNLCQFLLPSGKQLNCYYKNPLS